MAKDTTDASISAADNPAEAVEEENDDVEIADVVDDSLQTTET